MQAAEQPARFRALDGMRGLFAVAVAALHCNVYGYFYDLPLVRSAYLAVDFFFVLSGFVISHASSARPRAGAAGALPAPLDSWRSVGSFIVRRFGRVWPLHAVMLACFVALELMKWLALARGASVESLPFGTPWTRPLAIPAHLLLVHALHLFPSNTWNSPSWSISTEFYAYILFAVCTLLLRRWLVAVALALSGLSAWVLFGHVETMNTTFDWAMLRCVYGFFVGYLTYRVYQRVPAPRAGGTLVELALLVVTVLFMVQGAQNQLSLLAPLVFAVSIWFLAFERGALSRGLRSAPLRALGKWSYAIYMVHEFVFSVLMRGCRVLSRVLHVDVFIIDDWSRLPDTFELLSFGPRWWMDAIALLVIAITVGLAYLANRFIELPAQAYFQRRAKQLDERPLAPARSDEPILVARARESFP